MAATKKSAATKSAMASWKMSWKNLFISASVAANIGFVVLVVTMMSTHALDGMFIKEGLTRYCANDNNDKFTSSSTNVKALRAYTCASGDAKQFFDDGFSKYVESLAVKE